MIPQERLCIQVHSSFPQPQSWAGTIPPSPYRTGFGTNNNNPPHPEVCKDSVSSSEVYKHLLCSSLGCFVHFVLNTTGDGENENGKSSTGGKEGTDHKGAFSALGDSGALEMNVGNSFLKVKPTLGKGDVAPPHLPGQGGQCLSELAFGIFDVPTPGKAPALAELSMWCTCRARWEPFSLPQPSFSLLSRFSGLALVQHMLILPFPRCLLSSPAPNLTWLQKCLLHPNQAGAGLLIEALDGAAAHPVTPWLHVWELLNHFIFPLLPLHIQLFIGSHSHLKRFCLQNKSLLNSSRLLFLGFLYQPVDAAAVTQESVGLRILIFLTSSQGPVGPSHPSLLTQLSSESLL